MHWPNREQRKIPASASVCVAYPAGTQDTGAQAPAEVIGLRGASANPFLDNLRLRYNSLACPFPPTPPQVTLPDTFLGPLPFECHAAA
ncbi:hypothetical protein PsYK624_047960 [Phanerochaete sordida]|uniref:Uncharacterized protein n=1 Tax=Phanerochaete sordida TaxID=48140 RepID=A0A9P3G3Z7_9APHY|nr:hypothetical protein PsYK624_047960 [Phanerochaete sordida]